MKPPRRDPEPLRPHLTADELGSLAYALGPTDTVSGSPQPYTWRWTPGDPVWRRDPECTAPAALAAENTT